MPDVVEHGVVDGLAHVLGRPLGVGRSDDLVLAVRGLVRREDPDLAARDLLAVDVDRLRDVVHLRLHLAELRRLQVQHLQEVVGQRVDLVGDRRQRLGRVPEQGLRLMTKAVYL